MRQELDVKKIPIDVAIFFEYRLSVMPETIAEAKDKNFWNKQVVEEKKKMQDIIKMTPKPSKSDPAHQWYERFMDEYENYWR